MELLRKAEALGGESLSGGFAYVARGLIVTALLILSLWIAACGGETSSGSTEKTESGSDTTVAESAGGSGGTTGAGRALTPAEATVGPDEETAMPASGIGDDETHPPPENPPEGVETYPAATNRNINGPIDYEREPPTNGDHAPIWQNCGFYATPVKTENAVHILDHGAVWISYRPDLPQGQIDALKEYGKERYILVSPYPGQPAPVIATAWRNQLYLENASDPRLRKFVDQFRLSDTAPRSGNGCVGGVGEPDT